MARPAPPVVDLRSDTVTRPTAAMRRAIAEAEVGDDVLGDDPTVRRLEERVATLLGKEAALFFPSGTQANQTGILLHAGPGTEVICEAGAHIYHYEMGAASAWAGCQMRPVPTGDGVLTPEAVRARLPHRLRARRPPRGDRTGADEPETNVVMIDLENGLDAEAAVRRLAELAVLVVPFGPTRLRAVTHLDIDGAGIERAGEALRGLASR